MVIRTKTFISSTTGEPYSVDVLEECPKCGGSRKIRLVVNGKEYVQDCACDCQNAAFEGRSIDAKQEKKERYLKDCFGFSAQRSMTFDSSSKDIGIFRDYCNDFENLGSQGFGMLLMGPKGTGKTYASCAVANELIERGKRCKVTSMPRLFNEVMDTFEGRQGRIDSLARFDLVVIDDYGQESSSEKMNEVAFQIIDVLYTSKTPMIVTTNLDIKAVGATGKAGSRIIERCYPIEMKDHVRSQRGVIEAFGRN